MLLSVTSLAAVLVLLTPSAPSAPPVSSRPEPLASVSPEDGRILAHTDLDGDGRQELLLALNDSCDDDGLCLLAVLQPREDGGFHVLLPPTRMWDLTAAPDAPSGGWRDLVEARREGAAMDDITIVRWRYDGQRYRREQRTEQPLPATPAWLS